MAQLQDRIASAIMGMKKILRRTDDESDLDEPIIQPTNRGNKLKRKAQYIHEGVLDTTNGPATYKRVSVGVPKWQTFNYLTSVCDTQKIEHAGYERYIISRNPPRLDEDGEVIDYEDEDAESDATVAEDNIYGEIKLENLLAPLTSAADLPTHPSLSAPYTSKALTEIVRSAEKHLQKEKVTLWRIKHLFTSFRGDEVWAPCGIMHTTYDDWLLRGPKGASHQTDSVDAVERPSMTWEAASDNGIRGDTADLKKVHVARHRSPTLRQSGADVATTEKVIVHDFIPDITQQETLGPTDATIIDGAFKVHTEIPSEENGTTAVESVSEDTHNVGNTSAGTSLNPEKGGSLDIVNPHPTAAPNGVHPVEDAAPQPLASDSNHVTPSAIPADGLPSPPTDEEDANSQRAAHRMTTRAQAHAASRTPSTPTRSASTSSAEDEEAPFIHPFFLFPTASISSRDSGLHPQQAEEARMLLLAYVSKQEEIVRGAQELYDGLSRAERMRKTVLKWAKAEGHVGEMSDGEDWYDREEWGLEEDLVKGRDEEEDDAAEGRGKKTRRRGADR